MYDYKSFIPLTQSKENLVRAVPTAEPVDAADAGINRDLADVHDTHDLAAVNATGYLFQITVLK